MQLLTTVFFGVTLTAVLLQAARLSKSTAFSDLQHVILFGPSLAGKTTLLRRLLGVEPVDQASPAKTHFNDYFARTIHGTPDDLPYKHWLWDTSGRERTGQLSLIYYRMAHISIIVYDVTKPNSLVLALKFIDSILEINDKPCKLILVGNKIDAKTAEVRPTIKKAHAYCKAREMLHIPVSAKTGKNVDKLVHILDHLLLEGREELALSEQIVNLQADESKDEIIITDSCCD